MTTNSTHCEHEGVDFLPDLLVRQAVLAFFVGFQQEVQEGQPLLFTQQFVLFAQFLLDVPACQFLFPFLYHLWQKE